MKTNVYTLLLCFVSLGSFAQENIYKIDENFKINLNGVLKLYSDDANVTIKGEDRIDAHVYVYRNHVVKGLSIGDKSFQVEIEEEDGNLYITEREEGNVSMIGYSRLDYEIVIAVPKTVNLKLKGDDDDYDISNVKGFVKIDADDSDVNLKNCTGSEFHFDMDDGDVTMDKGNGDLYAKLDDGDINIDNGNFESVEISTDDGDIDIATSLSSSGEYNFRVDDGNLTFRVLGGGGSFDIKHDDGNVSIGNEYNIIESSENYKSFRLKGGDAFVKIRCNDSRISLR